MASPTRNHDLYIAIFARTSHPERTYHWALLVCASNSSPKATNGVRYHVTNSIQTPSPETPNPPPQNINGRIPWRYEAQPLANLFTASPLLARILISQISDPTLVSTALAAVPLIQDDRSWTCRVWVRDALANLAKQDLIALSTHLPHPTSAPTTNGRLSLADETWTAIENACRAYVEKKHAELRWSVAGDTKSETFLGKGWQEVVSKVSPFFGYRRRRWIEGDVPTWDLRDHKELVA